MDQITNDVFDQFINTPDKDIEAYFTANELSLVQNTIYDLLQSAKIQAKNKQHILQKENFLVLKAVEELLYGVTGTDMVAFYEQAHKFLLHKNAAVYMQEIVNSDPPLAALQNLHLQLISILKNEGLEIALYELEMVILRELVGLINSREAAQDIVYKKELLEEAIKLERTGEANVFTNMEILGTIYIKLPEGNHEENIEYAIYYLQEALKYFTRERNELQVAKITNHLGRAFLERQHGDAAENKQQALLLLEQPSKVLEAGDKLQWGGNQLNLGMLYFEMGNDYVDKAISCFNNALSVYEPMNRVAECSRIHMYLGNLYYNTKQGDDETNLEKSIDHFEKSMTGITKNSAPELWNNVQRELAVAYSHRKKGNKEENLQKAKTHFDAAMEFVRRQDDVDEMEALLYEIGDMYVRSTAKTMAEDVEKAIEYFNEGLRLKSREAPRTVILFHIEQLQDGIMYGKLKCGLGEAYLYRLKGDRAHNLETALRHYNDAAMAFLLPHEHSEIADYNNQMGIAYLERILGNREENLENAIARYNTAIENTPPETDRWFNFHMNLGNAYRVRVKGNKEENLKEAITYIETALRGITRDQEPNAWARCQNSLGNLYIEMQMGDVTKNLEKAVECYKNSISARSSGDTYFKAQVYNNLAVAYGKLKHIGALKKDDLIIQNYQLALEGVTADTDPFMALSICLSLGIIFYQQQNWQQSIDTFKHGHAAIENLRSGIQVEFRRKGLAIEASQLYKMLVSACLKVQDVDAAYTFCSAAKSRSLLDHINSSVASLDAVLASDKELAELWEPVAALRQEIDNLVLSLQQQRKTAGNIEPRPRKDVIEEIKRKRAKLNNELDRLFFSFPQLSSTSVARSINAGAARELSAQLENIPLIEFYNAEHGWVGFVVLPTGIQHVMLNVTAADIGEITDWLYAYEAGASWALEEEKVSQTLSRFYSVLFKPIAELLPGAGRLVLALFAELHMLPFNLCRNDGQYLAETIELTHIPSLSILSSLYMRRRQQQHLQNDLLLSIGYSAPESRVSLPHVIEARAIKPFFAPPPASVYLEEAGSLPDAIVDACSQSAFEVIHIACHANFDMEHPRDSGLLLSNGSILSVERIQTELRLTGHPLVTLSACETGRMKTAGADENLGLTYSFLAAGAGSTISSLWAVNDESTKELFTAFYGARQKYHSLSEALQHSMLHVKGTPRWNKPFFWGSFYFTGLPLKL